MCAVIYNIYIYIMSISNWRRHNLGDRVLDYMKMVSPKCSFVVSMQEDYTKVYSTIFCD